MTTQIIIILAIILAFALYTCYIIARDNIRELRRQLSILEATNDRNSKRIWKILEMLRIAQEKISNLTIVDYKMRNEIKELEKENRKLEKEKESLIKEIAEAHREDFSKNLWEQLGISKPINFNSERISDFPPAANQVTDTSQLVSQEQIKDEWANYGITWGSPLCNPSNPSNLPPNPQDEIVQRKENELNSSKQAESYVEQAEKDVIKQWKEDTVRVGMMGDANKSEETKKKYESDFPVKNRRFEVEREKIKRKETTFTEIGKQEPTFLSVGTFINNSQNLFADVLIMKFRESGYVIRISDQHIKAEGCTVGMYVSAGVSLDTYGKLAANNIYSSVYGQSAEVVARDIIEDIADKVIVSFKDNLKSRTKRNE